MVLEDMMYYTTKFRFLAKPNCKPNLKFSKKARTKTRYETRKTGWYLDFRAVLTPSLKHEIPNLVSYLVSLEKRFGAIVNWVLKYFFTSAISSSNGGDYYSSEAVRHKIKTLIGEERPSSILSDDKLVELLNNDGVDIARRTVAKYREALKIPSSVHRRRLRNRSTAFTLTY